MSAEFLLVSKSCFIWYAKSFLIFCNHMYLINSLLLVEIWEGKVQKINFIVAAMVDYGTGFVVGFDSDFGCKFMF